MRYLLKFTIPLERGNEALRQPDFGQKMHSLLTDLKVEGAYFTALDGQRGGYFVVNMTDASQIPAIAEPLFLWLHADIEFIPVMTPEDLEKAGPSIGAAIQKWG